MPRERKPAPTTSRALGYCRVSTTEQVQHGISLDAQRAALERLAREKGFELVEVFEDAGISGTTLDRPGLQALLDRIAGNQRRKASERIAAVLAVKLDRLSRDTYDGIGLAVRLQAAGVALVTLEDGEVDRRDPMQELMHTLRLAVARFEVRQTQARTKFALRRKRERGERAGTVPYGHQLTGDGSDKIEPNEAEQKVLRLLAELRGADYSLHEIARELNAQGYTTRRGTGWRREYVHRLLRDRSVA